MQRIIRYTGGESSTPIVATTHTPAATVLAVEPSGGRSDHSRRVRITGHVVCCIVGKRHLRQRYIYHL